MECHCIHTEIIPLDIQAKIFTKWHILANRFFQKGFVESQNILTTSGPALSPGSYGTLKLSGSLLPCNFSSFCLSCAITAITSKKTQWNQKLEGKKVIDNQTCWAL